MERKGLMTSIDQFVGLHAQMNELIKRVGNGSLSVDDVKRGLQNIMDPRTKIMGWVPSWWRTPEDQIKRARKLWPGIDLPSPPESFAPSSPSHILLLHVPCLTMNELWCNVEVAIPQGATRAFLSHADMEKLASPHEVGDKPAWVEYDSRPQVDLGRGDNYVAACEALLSACIQFDGYLSWVCRHGVPVLARAKGAEDDVLLALSSKQQGRCTNYDEGCCIEGRDCTIEHWDEYRLELVGDELPRNHRWAAPALILS